MCVCVLLRFDLRFDRGFVDAGLSGPGLSRVHEEALGALHARGVRGAAALAEAACAVRLGDGVCMDVAAVRLLTDRRAAEAGDGGGLGLLVVFVAVVTAVCSSE